jgi:hypothetical protein
LPTWSHASANARCSASIGAAAEPGFRAGLAALAARLNNPDAEVEARAAASRMSRLSETLGELWLPWSVLEDALALLEQSPAPVQTLSPARRLLADLKRDQREWLSAQAEAKSADLEAIAVKRALIPAAAIGTGLSADMMDDVEAVLPTLSGDEIMALHRHFTLAAGRQALVRGVRLAIDAMDTAAGSGGLAARMDRSGDPLVGMTRIGSATEPVMRELARLPEARKALVALNTWINACIPAPEAGHQLSEQLVRNVKSYGCFLLMHAVKLECRALMEPTTSGGGALAGRLASGLAETLPLFAAAAAARAGGDIELGATFIDRLPGIHGKSAA